MPIGRAPAAVDPGTRKLASRKPEEPAKPPVPKPKPQLKAAAPVLDDRLGF
jgi:hypothetical protein